MEFEDFDLRNETNNKKQKNSIAKIKVIGVGGAGNNAVNRMLEDEVMGIDFIVANTDEQVLNESKAKIKLILGKKITKGLGAGANPQVGKEAAIESTEEIKSIVNGVDLVFIASGMGGGTGTGAAPVIAKIAREAGALVVGIVTTPFKFEGTKRTANATAGLIQFYENVDSIIIVSNDRLLLELGSIPLKDSFKYSDAVLKQAVRTITDLIAMPALINLDFADIKAVMENQGPALIGIGNAKGENKAVEAAINAINSPILEASIDGAKNAIINITGGNNFTLEEANKVVDTIQNAANEKINILFGVSTNDELEDELIVSVIATGLKGTSRPQTLRELKIKEEQQKNSNSSKTELSSDISLFKSDGFNGSEKPLNIKEDETLVIDTNFGGYSAFDAEEEKEELESEEDKEKELPDFLKGL